MGGIGGSLGRAQTLLSLALLLGRLADNGPR